MQLHGITPTELIHQTKYSRKHLIALRKGAASPTLESATTILLACEAITGKRLELGDLFETASLRRKAS